MLGGLAPAGLQIAQGVPVAEALMPIGPLLATSGASVRELKNKREAAAKAAALDMASDQFAASQKLTERDRTKDLYRGTELISRGVDKPQKPLGAGTAKDYRYTGKEPADIPGVGTIQPGQIFPIGGNELNTVFKSIRTQLKEVKDPPKPQAAGSQQPYVFKGDKPTNIPGIGVLQPGEELDLGSNELSKLGNLRRLFKRKDTSDTAKTTYFNADTVIDGVTYKANVPYALPLEVRNKAPKGSFSFAAPDKPETPSIYFDNETGQNELVSPEDYNKDKQRYGPKKPDTSNKLKEVFSTAKKKNVLRTESEILQDIEKGTGLFEPKRTETKAEKLTVSAARRDLTGVADKIVKGAKDPETLNRFDQLMSTIMSKPGFNLAAPGQEGGYFVSENPVVPRIALQAIEQIRTFDPKFPDYGLLTGETKAIDVELLEIVDGITDFSDANL